MLRWTYVVSTHKHRDGTGLLRIRLSFASSRVDVSLGLRVELTKWDAETMRVRPNTTHTAKRVPANYINRQIQDAIDVAERLFGGYSDRGVVPTAAEVKRDYTAALTGAAPAAGAVTFTAVADRMAKELGSVRQWTISGYDKVSALIRKVEAMTPGVTTAEMDGGWMDAFTRHLTYSDRLNNSTVTKYLDRVRQVLRYAARLGYAVAAEALAYDPHLKVIPKPVIFLTWEELMGMLSADLPYPYLAKARDLFCFACFTGLRYSDLSRLRPEDVSEGYISVVTQKTSDPLRIDLNDYSRAILAKYDNRLPRLSLQKANAYIKEVGMYCGINTPVHSVSIVGGERVERVQPKWQLLTTHAGRRTFICNALRLGIPPNVVMQWTGHKDYAAMRPYIAVADETKRAMMQRFDALPNG